MKIASPHCGLSPESNSGGETYEREILKNMAQLGVQFEIILAKDKLYPEGISQFHIHRLPIRKGLRWYVSNFVWPFYLKKIEKTYGFDLLRIHSLRFTGPGVLWFNRWGGRKYPIVAHFHHIDPDPYNFIDRWVAKCSDHLITVSEFSKSQMVDQYQVPREKITVIPNGISNEYHPKSKSKELTDKYGISNHKVVLFLGGLKKRKKLFLLIDVFREVKKQYPKNLKLIIAGSGPLEDSLKAYALKTQENPGIIFTGYIQENQKVDLYNLCDVYVFPTELEGFGFGPAEAMACGKPVVASKVGALHEVVDDNYVGYLSNNSVDDFARKILKLLLNEKECVQFGKNARKKILEKYQWPDVAKRTLQTYEAIIRNHEASRA